MTEMRTRLVRITVAAAVMLAAVSGAWGAFIRLRADHDRFSRRQLQKLEQEWSDAFNNRDAQTLRRLLAEDFVAVNEIGEISSKEQYIDFVANRIRVLSGGIDDLQIITYGDTGIAVARFTGTVEIDGQVVESDFRFIDVWVNRYGRWYAISTQDSPIQE